MLMPYSIFFCFKIFFCIIFFWIIAFFFAVKTAVKVCMSFFESTKSCDGFYSYEFLSSQKIAKKIFFLELPKVALTKQKH